MSIGVLERRAGIAQFVDEKVRDPRTRAMMERVHVYVDPEIEALGYNEMRMKVDITLADGRKLSGYADKAKGHPKKPMSRDDLHEKFMDCASLVMPAAAAESALEHLWAIRQIDGAAALMPMLVGSAP
jgi:2-methylcitrate dehydratase PrpD